MYSELYKLLIRILCVIFTGVIELVSWRWNLKNVQLYFDCFQSLDSTQTTVMTLSQCTATKLRPQTVPIEDQLVRESCVLVLIQIVTAEGNVTVQISAYIYFLPLKRC